MSEKRMRERDVKKKKILYIYFDEIIYTALFFIVLVVISCTEYHIKQYVCEYGKIYIFMYKK